jgi:hypothetical protein
MEHSLGINALLRANYRFLSRYKRLTLLCSSVAFVTNSCSLMMQKPAPKGTITKTLLNDLSGWFVRGPFSRNRPDTDIMITCGCQNKWEEKQLTNCWPKMVSTFLCLTYGLQYAYVLQRNIIMKQTLKCNVQLFVEKCSRVIKAICVYDFLGTFCMFPIIVTNS